MKATPSIALILVMTLGLNACGDEKKNKRHQTEVEKVTEVVTANQNTEGSVDAEKKDEAAPVSTVVEPAQPEGPAVEPTPEVPAVEPAQPEAPAVEPTQPEGPAVDPTQPEVPAGKPKPEAPVIVEPTPEEPGVACTLEVIPYCVQTGKGQYELLYFGRSAPECKFPEAPANLVDAANCAEGSDTKAL